MGNVIEIKNLCKEYQGFCLQKVSFDVQEGMCCGFVGPNGAGKTTTLKIMAGMAFKSSGEVRLLGCEAGSAAVKEELGVMFDQPYFQEDWTALDIERGVRRFYRRWNTGQYRDYLSCFGLDPRKKFKDFSRGMKMKLGLALHLSHDARLLLLDEPTGGLDPAARDELMDILREYLVKEGRTVLLSTHITGDLEHIADQIVYISEGKILYCGDKEELVSSYCMVRGSTLPEEKKKHAIGLREYGSGYECLMELSHIGGLPGDSVTEKAAIEDVVVYMERGSKMEKASAERAKEV